MNIVKNMVKNNGLDKRYLRKYYLKFSASKPLVARSNRVRNAMFLFCSKHHLWCFLFINGAIILKGVNYEEK